MYGNVNEHKKFYIWKWLILVVFFFSEFNDNFISDYGNVLAHCLYFTIKLHIRYYYTHILVYYMVMVGIHILQIKDSKLHKFKTSLYIIKSRFKT